MKRLVFIAAIILLAGFNLSAGNPQSVKLSSIKPYPIPSYNTGLSGTGAFFEYNYTGANLDGKRRINIRVTTMSYFASGDALVWAYCPELNQKLGPISANSEEIVSFLIDDNKWGALVKSNEELNVDVWIDDIITPEY
jgi:hypothetical protein